MKFLTTIAAAAALLALLVAPTIARADDSSGTDWDGKTHVDVTPYVWLPTLNATFRYHLSNLPPLPPSDPPPADATQTFDAQVGPNKYLANLNFAMMASATIRRGNLALFTDVLNANVTTGAARALNLTGPAGNFTSTISSQTQIQAVTTLWTVAPTFTVYHSKTASIDLLAGGQFLTLSTNANLQLTGPLGNLYTAGISRSQTYGDFIVGATGHVQLARHLSVPYEVDAGIGAPTSFQALIGLRYGNTSLAWRQLNYNAASSGALVQSLHLGGPMLGYTFRF